MRPKIIRSLDCRHGFPPILADPQWIWTPPNLRPEIFALFTALRLACKSATDRTRLNRLQISVLGIVRLRLAADFDRVDHRPLTSGPPVNNRAARLP